MENNQNNQLSNKERYLLKQQEGFKAQNIAARKRILKRAMKIVAVVVIVSGAIGGLTWFIANQPKTPESEIISQGGIHWHPNLSIYIKGKPQEIPANIGIGITHQPIHTHDATGQLHLEIQGLVTKDDIKLNRFFKIWGKQFTASCIFDSCTGQNGTLKMLVNGKKNNGFGNYEMQDGDKIEIRFE